MMNQQIEALKMAIEAFRNIGIKNELLQPALDACKEALESQEQEPVAWMYQREDGAGTLNFDRNFALIDKGYKETPLYTHPAQPLTRDWIGTVLERADKDEAFRKGLIGELAQQLSDDEMKKVIYAVEDKFGMQATCAIAIVRATEQAHGIGV